MYNRRSDRDVGVTGYRRSEYSGTQGVVAKRHVEGRRDNRRFNLPYQRDRLQAHIADLMAQLRRAIRLDRPEKQLKLVAMLSRANDTVRTLNDTICERDRHRPIAVKTGGHKVLLDLTYRNHAVWGPQRGRWTEEMVNNKRVIKL